MGWPRAFVNVSIIAAVRNVFGLVISLLLVAGCGSAAPAVGTATAGATATPATSAPTLSQAALAQQYLALVGPYNAALNTFNGKLAHTASNASPSQLQTISTPLANALQQFDSAVLRAPWPPGVLTDVHALTTSDAPQLSDLENAGSPSAVMWYSQFQRDTTAAAAAANVVRADLGLPPPPGTTPTP
jgi:hypothetical protein